MVNSDTLTKGDDDSGEGDKGDKGEKQAGGKSPFEYLINMFNT